MMVVLRQRVQKSTGAPLKLLCWPSTTSLPGGRKAVDHRERELTARHALTHTRVRAHTHTHTHTCSMLRSLQVVERLRAIAREGSLQALDQAREEWGAACPACCIA